MIDLKPAHRALARKPRSGNAIRLYWWLCFELDPLEYRPIKIQEMSSHLSMERAGVIRALRILIAFGLIQRNGRAWSRGPYTYRLILNPPDPTVGENTPIRAA